MMFAAWVFGVVCGVALAFIGYKYYEKKLDK